jgi:hypothetical protein
MRKKKKRIGLGVSRKILRNNKNSNLNQVILFSSIITKVSQYLKSKIGHKIKMNLL